MPEARISDATFYTWKAKYGGLEVSEARRLKSLEEENRRLKKLLAAASRCRTLSPKASSVVSGTSA